VSTRATDLPPLVSPANPARLPGKMVFAALVTPDLLAAERFYTSLFDWQFQNAYVGERLFGEASFDGRTIAAIVQRPVQDGKLPAWRSFLSTADLDKSVRSAVHNGASVLVDPHQLANVGRDALLADPQGAVFGLLESSSGDPPDILAAPGEWIWSSLVTTDPRQGAAFYEAVLGYDSFPLPDPQETRHFVLASETFARASVNPLPSSRPVHPRWISYVRVSDMTEMVGKATSLGARVVVPAHQDRNGGTIALIADPAGALFGLLEWTDQSRSDTTDAGDAK
jgi:predicted enzyme related to lactoylglutathione lyase